jgi:hypothetical protein
MVLFHWPKTIANLPSPDEDLRVASHKQNENVADALETTHKSDSQGRDVALVQTGLSQLAMKSNLIATAIPIRPMSVATAPLIHSMKCPVRKMLLQAMC